MISYLCFVVVLCFVVLCRLAMRQCEKAKQQSTTKTIVLSLLAFVALYKRVCEFWIWSIDWETTVSLTILAGCVVCWSFENAWEFWRLGPSVGGKLSYFSLIEKYLFHFPITHQTTQIWTTRKNKQRSFFTSFTVLKKILRPST